MTFTLYVKHQPVRQGQTTTMCSTLFYKYVGSLKSSDNDKTLKIHETGFTVLTREDLKV